MGAVETCLVGQGFLTEAGIDTSSADDVAEFLLRRG
jgi:hypothetical protein